MESENEGVLPTFPEHWKEKLQKLGVSEELWQNFEAKIGYALIKRIADDASPTADHGNAQFQDLVNLAGDVYDSVSKKGGV